MQIVIEMSERTREKIFDILNNGLDFPLGLQCVLLNAIAKGTVLPKHGDLVDRSEIEVEEDVYNQTYIIHAPTILEANK